jgi:L-ribulose-5-phosphate 3-epimerase
MKISMSYWMFEGGLEGQKPVVQAMQEAKDMGYEAIELCISSQGVLTEKTTQAECEAIRKKADEIGIELVGVASGESWTSSPSASDPNVRTTIIKFTQKALRITRWLGVDAYLFIPGSVDIFFLPDGEVVPYDICYDRAKEAITQILPVAEEVGVHLALENVWNKFLLSPLEFRDFIDSFDSKWVGAYFDVGNVMQTGYPDQWIRLLGNRIKRVHIKDFKLSIGTAEGFVDLTEGDVDFKAIKTALSEIGYEGYVTAEMIPHAPGRPEKTVKAMTQLFK